MHVAPQSTPTGALVTVPTPGPLFVSASVRVVRSGSTGATYIPRPCVAVISLSATGSSLTSTTIKGGSPAEVLFQLRPPFCDQNTPTSVATYSVAGDVRQSISIAFAGAFGRFAEMFVQCAPKSVV